MPINIAESEHINAILERLNSSPPIAPPPTPLYPYMRHDRCFYNGGDGDTNCRNFGGRGARNPAVWALPECGDCLAEPATITPNDEINQHMPTTRSNATRETLTINQDTFRVNIPISGSTTGRIRARAEELPDEPATSNPLAALRPSLAIIAKLADATGSKDIRTAYNSIEMYLEEGNGESTLARRLKQAENERKIYKDAYEGNERTNAANRIRISTLEQQLANQSTTRPIIAPLGSPIPSITGEQLWNYYKHYYGEVTEAGNRFNVGTWANNSLGQKASFNYLATQLTAHLASLWEVRPAVINEPNAPPSNPIEVIIHRPEGTMCGSSDENCGNYDHWGDGRYYDREICNSCLEAEQDERYNREHEGDL